MAERIDAGEVKRLLAANIERFCEEHFSSGRRVRGMWKVGGVDNSPGDSLVIHLDGARQGQFYENNPSERATNVRSLIDLFGARYGMGSFKDSLAGCEEWLRQIGVVHDGGFTREIMRPVQAIKSPPLETAAPKIDPRDKWEPVKEGSEVWKYLVEERGLAPAVLERYKIGEGKFFFAEFQKSVLGFVCPTYVDGVVLTAKFIALDRIEGKDGKMHKVTRVCAGTTSAHYHLWGQQAVDPKEGHVVVTEGEIDAMSWASDGVQAVSLPMGAKEDREGQPNHGNDWIENDFEWLKLWQAIGVALDSDNAGRAATRSVVPRLGKERCRIINYPEGCKDANDVLLAERRGKLPQGSLETAFLDGEDWSPASFRRASEYRQEIWDEFFGTGGEGPGLELPWKMPFKLRRGELSVWSGYSKHGKTVCQTFVMVALASRGEKVCIASLEMPPRATLKNIMRMSLGRSKPVKLSAPDVFGRTAESPDEDLFNRAMRWMDSRFFVYGKTGQASVADVLEVFRFAAKRYGVTQFVLDSLMMLDAAEDDLEQIKGLMQQLKGFAAEYDVHVHLVAHAKKSDSIKRPEDRYPPRKHDIFGSVSITNICDNVITVWRNISKDAKLADAEAKKKPLEDISAIEHEPDAMILIQAQRGGNGDLPAKNLWFDQAGSWQYFDRLSDLLSAGPRVYIV